MLRGQHLVLVGFMGSGKTTVGQLLAEKLERPFIDLDDRIRERSGLTIPDYFDLHGEAAFRRLEAEVLQEALTEAPSVIATGGGAFSSAQNRERIAANGVSAWLDVPFEVAAERSLGDADRPLARDPQRFRQLYQDRQSYYQQADLRVDTATVPPEAITDDILDRLGRRNPPLAAS